MRYLCLLLFCLVATACAKPTPVIIYLTPPPTATTTPTVTPSPPPATLTPTITPLRFPTQAEGQSLASPFAPGTPLPTKRAPLTIANAAQVRELARWGLGKINTYAYAPDGRWLALGTTLGLYVHRADNYTTAITLPTAASVQAVVFTADGQTLWAALQDGSVWQWDTATWVPQTLFIPRTPTRLTVSHLVIDPNSRYVALATHSEVSPYDLIIVWDVVQQRKVLQQAGQGPLVFLDAAHFVFASAIGELTLLDLAQGDPQTWVLPAGTAPNFVLDATGHLMAQTPTGLAYFAWGSPTPAYTLPLDVRFTSGPPLAKDCVGAVIYNPTPVTLAFDPAHHRLAVLLLDGTLQLYQITSTHLQLVTEMAGLASVPVFAPDGETLLARAKDNQQLAVWRVADGALRHRFSDYVDEFTTVSFSPDGALLVAAAPHAESWVWRVADGQRLWSLGAGVTNVAFEFHPDGTQLLATGHLAGVINVWDLPTRSLQSSFNAHIGQVNQLYLSQNFYLLSSGADCVLRLWAWRDGKVLDTLPLGNGGMADTLGLEPETHLVLASLGYRGPLQAWQVFSAEAPHFTPLALDFPPDYRQLTFWPRGGLMLLQSAAGVEFAHLSLRGMPRFPLQLAELRERQPTLLRLSPALELVAGMGQPNFELLLWSLKSGEGLAVLPGHQAPLTAIAFEPNNAFIATASADGTVRLWGVNP